MSQKGVGWLRPASMYSGKAAGNDIAYEGGSCLRRNFISPNALGFRALRGARDRCVAEEVTHDGITAG
jgi:hypothetical protein